MSAQLELYEAGSSTAKPVAMGAYRVTTPWATGATWSTTDGIVPWTTPGGDYVGSETEAEAVINSTVGKANGWTYWHPTKMVQGWYNGEAAPRGEGHPDFGFILKDVNEVETSNFVSFDGRESANPPGLSMEWVQRGVGNGTNYTMLSGGEAGGTSLKINAASGNLMLHSTDLALPGKGLAFSVARSWNSLASEAPGYGYGWVDTNATYVEIEPEGSIAFTDGSGNTFPFVKKGVNYVTPPGIAATMCAAGSAAPCPQTLPKGATYELIYTGSPERISFKGQATQEYRNNPVANEDSSGDKQTAHYTGELEQPTSWTDTEGRTISYTESDVEGYTKVVDNTDHLTMSYHETLSEDGEYHLTEYTSPTKEVTKYAYGGANYLENNWLEQITAPNGSAIKMTYDSIGRVASIAKQSSSGTSEGTTAYWYYEIGTAPEPCTTNQKAAEVSLSTSPEQVTVYCANVLDEVERSEVIYRDTLPPVFHEFETSAYDESSTAPTIIYFRGAEDPLLPNGKPGSGVASYDYRYSVNGGAFTSWASASGTELSVPYIAPGTSYTLEVYATDFAGNVSATVRASGVVPSAGQGSWLGAEDLEEDPSLLQEFATNAISVPLRDAEGGEEAKTMAGTRAGSEQDSSNVAPDTEPVQKHSEIVAKETEVRSGYLSFVIGNVTKGMKIDVKGQNFHEYYAKFYNYTGVCGWVVTQATKQQSTEKLGTCPAATEIAPNEFAKLVDCACTESKSVLLQAPGTPGKYTDKKIPVYRNVRPFAHGHEHAHEAFTSIDTANATGARKSVFWRYVTYGGQFALVSIEYPLNSGFHKWAFIERKWLPENGFFLCGSKNPETDRARPTWPSVCP